MNRLAIRMFGAGQEAGWKLSLPVEPWLLGMAE
jgi:hypothetical protein